MSYSATNIIPDQDPWGHPYSGRPDPLSGHGHGWSGPPTVPGLRRVDDVISVIPDGEPEIWFWKRNGELSVVIREERPPLRGNRPGETPEARTYAIRVDIDDVRPSDRFGSWTVLILTYMVVRRHGWPCHCRWDTHGSLGIAAGCSYDNPACPCWWLGRSYRVVCRCDCGTVKKVAVSGLVTAHSLSCGHCTCRPDNCRAKERYELGREGLL
jgi:hypothetical protein